MHVHSFNSLHSISATWDTQHCADGNSRPVRPAMKLLYLLIVADRGRSGKFTQTYRLQASNDFIILYSQVRRALVQSAR